MKLRHPAIKFQSTLSRFCLRCAPDDRCLRCAPDETHDDDRAPAFVGRRHRRAPRVGRLLSRDRLVAGCRRRRMLRCGKMHEARAASRGCKVLPSSQLPALRLRQEEAPRWQPRPGVLFFARRRERCTALLALGWCAPCRPSPSGAASGGIPKCCSAYGGGVRCVECNEPVAAGGRPGLKCCREYGGGPCCVECAVDPRTASWMASGGSASGTAAARGASEHCGLSSGRSAACVLGFSAVRARVLGCSAACVAVVCFSSCARVKWRVRDAPRPQRDCALR